MYELQGCTFPPMPIGTGSMRRERLGGSVRAAHDTWYRPRRSAWFHGSGCHQREKSPVWSFDRQLFSKQNLRAILPWWRLGSISARTSLHLPSSSRFAPSVWSPVYGLIRWTIHAASHRDAGLVILAVLGSINALRISVDWPKRLR